MQFNSRTNVRFFLKKFLACTLLFTCGCFMPNEIGGHYYECKISSALPDFLLNGEGISDMRNVQKG